MYKELESLKSPDIYLDIPMSLEVTGSPGNWVALWEETDTMKERVEGEGKTIEEAMDDCRECLVTMYFSLQKKVISGTAMQPDEERTWLGMCRYIGTSKHGRARPGEEFSASYGSGDAYKGPVFG